MKKGEFVNEEVTIERSDIEISLAGTLSLPKGKGPHPGILMLTGSGGHTRDQIISGLPMFEIIGNFLAENGYAVLRVDDRGEGLSTGSKVRESTTMDRAQDAQAALNYLMKLPNIDTSHVGLLGHSEGTHTAAMVATALADVDFVIMLSPWAISGSELWVWQQGTILRDEGTFTEEKIKSIETELFKMVSHIGSENSDEGFFKYGGAACLAWGDPPEDITNEFITDAFGDLRQPWYEHFFSSNPKESLVKLNQPVLALFGSEDKQTPPSLNVNYLSTYLIKASNADFTIKVLPNEDHFFMTGDGLKPNEHVSGKMKMSENALFAMKYWLEQQHIKK
ncbi:MAG: alpha/beta hydrolase [Maribacter sp.]|nr:alpha/beta hydrolase [Maribacter sp.]